MKNKSVLYAVLFSLLTSLAMHPSAKAAKMEHYRQHENLVTKATSNTQDEINKFTSRHTSACQAIADKKYNANKQDAAAANNQGFRKAAKTPAITSARLIPGTPEYAAFKNIL